jgi:hypothetical protein
MASNDFLVFAGGAGANVITQSTYASLAALGPGFTAGIANSNQLNKVWRQSSIMASVLGQFMAAVSGQNSTDDGTTSTLLTNLMTAVNSAAMGLETGSGNTYQVALTPSVQVVSGIKVRFISTHTNTGAATFSVNGSPARALVGIDGAALAGGEIVNQDICEVVYQSTSSQWVLLENVGGWQKAPTASVGDKSTKVATTQFVDSVAFGSGGQTWSTVASPTINPTAYTNNTGRPILWTVSLAGSGTGGGSAAMYINGSVIVNLILGSGNPGANGTLIVPPGATYGLSITAGGFTPTVSIWALLS